MLPRKKAAQSAAPNQPDPLHAAAMLVLAAVFAATGIYILKLTLDMVSSYGESLGVDAKSQRLYAQAHVAVHLFGPISAVAIGVFRTSGNKVLAGFAVALTVLCGGYGVMNMIGFASTNRVAVAEAKTAANNADERQYQAAVAAKQADIAWTRGTIIKEEYPREKRRLEVYLAKKEKELADLKPPKPTAATVLADPQAAVFAKLIGMTADTWQMVLPIPGALLLYLAELFSSIFAVQLILGAIAEWRAARPIRQGVSGDRGRVGTGGSARLGVVSDGPVSAKSMQVASADTAASVTQVSNLSHQIGDLSHSNLPAASVTQVKSRKSRRPVRGAEVIDAPGAWSGARLGVVPDADGALAGSRQAASAEAASVTQVSELSHNGLPTASPSFTQVKSSSKSRRHGRGSKVISTDGPQRKLGPEQLIQVVREDLACGHGSSSYELASRTGWSQSTVNRRQRRLRGQRQLKS